MRILAVTIIVFITSTSAFGRSDEDRCRSYAGGAVASANANINMKCGFTGDKWGQNFDGHLKWCLGVRQSTQENEDRIRERDLNACKRAKGGSPSHPPAQPPQVKYCTSSCEACSRDGLRCTLSNNCSFGNVNNPWACY
jgi:hypothetical protein